MPVYRATIAGRTKPVLVRDDSAAKASSQLVQLKALTSDEMADALASGEKVWKPGEELEADDKPADPPAQPSKGADAE